MIHRNKLTESIIAFDTEVWIREANKYVLLLSNSSHETKWLQNPRHSLGSVVTIN